MVTVQCIKMFLIFSILHLTPIFLAYLKIIFEKKKLELNLNELKGFFFFFPNSVIQCNDLFSGLCVANELMRCPGDESFMTYQAFFISLLF